MQPQFHGLVKVNSSTSNGLNPELTVKSDTQCPAMYPDRSVITRLGTESEVNVFIMPYIYAFCPGRIRGLSP